jgi:hypothetical protein
MNYLKQIQDRIDDILDIFGHYYYRVIILLHIVYIFVFVGIIALNSVYLKAFNILVQSFVCAFLMFRFHPFRSHKLREYDAKIIFGSAGFLLFNMIFVEFFSVYKYSTGQTNTNNSDSDANTNKENDNKINSNKATNPLIQGLVPLQFQ